jgi:mannose-1-phosphate guanylyltransferase
MILAAGAGTRLRPLTDRMPKCMVPIGGKPLLEHTIEWLHGYGVSEIAINLCYMPGAVMEHFGDGRRWGVRITYSLEEDALGTAGGVRKMAGFFDGPCLVWYADNLSRCRIDRLIEQHRDHAGLATIALFQRDDVSQSGIVGMDESGRITRFLEKPRPEEVFSHWVNAGIYILEPSVLECILSCGAPDFGRDVFPRFIAAGQPLYGYKLASDEGLWWIDRPEDLARVRQAWEESAR